jgi:hypothetical protein
MTGCHPERPVVVSRANRSRRPQAVIQVSLKNGPVMPHIRVFRRWMRGIIWISSTVHAFRVCKACRQEAALSQHRVEQSRAFVRTGSKAGFRQ